jgi:MSHA pilin protein MshC
MRVRCSCFCLSRSRGYSLIELIVVIVLLGILAAIIAPHLNISSFRSAGFFQQSLAAIRFAQKQAISTGCSVQVDISGGMCELNWSGCAGNAAILNPASGDTDFCADSEPEGAAPAANFTFNRIGAPTAAQSFSVDGRTIVVEANTGFAHEQ